MQITRQQIINHLQANRLATPFELSRTLQVTDANIRHHLKIMLTEGLVEVVGQEPVRGKGRPRYIYSLTPAAQEDNISILASALFATTMDGKSPAEQEEILSMVATKILGEKDEAPSGLRQKLDRAIRELNHFHYQSRWEASAEGPRVILAVCPYADILPDHPELCRLDQALLSELLDQPVEQTAKLERGPQGVPNCIFSIR